MRFRKLRIAWAVLWGLAAVLLIVMWVRSYWWADAVWYRAPNATAYCLFSDEGAVRMDRVGNEIGEYGNPPPIGWSHRKYWYAGYQSEVNAVALWRKVLRGFNSANHKRLLPYWVIVLASAACTAIPSLSWRFSLRTLLVATTLVAVVLDIIVWLSQAG